MKLILASNNAKKLAELQSLLAGLPLTLVSQAEFGVTEANEPHITFVENALAKARHASQHTGLPALADDSGLCVDALGGAPGVQSAVYAGTVQPQADRESQRRVQDTANSQKLLDALSGNSNRRASFVSVLVAVRHAQDPQPLIAQGRWAARILEAPLGEGGFGYDPLVWVDALQASVAQLPALTKNKHSHRALAAAQMRALMVGAWALPTAA
jgi:XTP/dITP diphosphohydrolase